MTRLAPPPRSPNCVSSRAKPTDRLHYVAPLVQTTLDRIRSVVTAMPRTEIIEESADYIHFVFKTAFFGFQDDVEFERDGAVIHVRSASRVGYGDLGTNRRRVESIRRALA